MPLSSFSAQTSSTAGSSAPKGSTAKPAARHTFLMAEGRWKLEGHWLLDNEGSSVPINGKLLVAWNVEDWFNLVGKIYLSPSSEAKHPFSETTFQYRGHFSAPEQYTFMLQHSHFGKIEGRGWILPDSIVQRFWMLGDRENRTGLEHLYRIDGDHYHWSSSIMNSHSLVSTMEAKLERQK
jgi:hypothetical protein